MSFNEMNKHGEGERGDYARHEKAVTGNVIAGTFILCSQEQYHSVHVATQPLHLDV